LISLESFGISLNVRMMGVFGNGLDWKKWTGTVADLINVRKKVRMFCIKK
jgi:hypothetical protein